LKSNNHPKKWQKRIVFAFSSYYFIKSAKKGKKITKNILKLLTFPFTFDILDDNKIFDFSGISQEK
jgi:hypothetical protein